MHEFLPLNLALSLYGCSILSYHRKWASILIKLINYFQFGLIFSLNVILCHQNYGVLNLQKGFIYAFTHFLQNLLAALTIGIFFKNRQKLTFLLESLQVYWSHGNGRHLKIFSTISAIVSVLWSSWLSAVYIYLTIQEEDPVRKRWLPVYAVTKWNGWDSSMILTYVFFVKGIHFMEMSLIDNSIGQLTKLKVDPSEFKKTSRCLYLISEMKNALMDTFGMIPSCWFLWGFIKSTVGIYAIGNQKENIILGINMQFLQLSVLLSLLLYLIFATGSIEKSKEERFDRLLLSIKEKVEEGHLECLSLIDQIRELRGFSYRAWDLFEINKGILLPFISNLVCFTVLFVQLAGTLTHKTQ